MGLAEAVTSIGRSALAVRRARRSGLPAAMRSEIAQAAIKLSLAGATGLPNPISLAGYRISYFEPRDLRYLFDEVFVQRSYYFHADTPAPVILDCGSNIGMSILFFKKLYPNARIVGFEPDPDTFALLRSNVERNDLADVTLHQCALSDKDGSIDFFRGAGSKGSLLMSVLRSRGGDEKVEVPARRLSPFIIEKVDLLKMDIEGAEATVLPELAASDKLRLVKQMHLEYHHHLARDSDTLSATLDLIEREGFGYQVDARPAEWGAPGTFQDIAIYCYRKD